MGEYPQKKARFYTYICRNMTHFRQSTQHQLPAYQYAYGDKTASGVCLQNIFDYSPFGAALDGRTMQGDGYRYGFNGMEKDDEVKGKGNSYTAEFWEYDTRLGRRWNIDPVVKPERSTYNAFSNNPIRRIDPRGDDDFFNSAGIYLGSSKEGNNVRVITTSVNIEDAIVKLEENTKLLTEFTYCPEDVENRKMLASIMTYYVRDLAIESVFVKDVEQKGKSVAAAAYSPCKSNKDDCDYDKFLIYVSNSTGEISYVMYDKFNIINTFVHEKKHEDDYSTHKPLNHVNAIITQSNDLTWIKTTFTFKRAMLGYAERLLNEALVAGNNIEEIQQKIQDVNNSPIKLAGELTFDNVAKKVVAINDFEDIKIEATKIKKDE